MRFEDVFTAASVAARFTSDPSNAQAYLGAALFPAQKKLGVDLKWIKAHRGLAVALKPSAFDAMSTIRPRKGFEMQATEMPLFRESMTIREMDMMQIARAQESNDPYVMDVIRRLYNDAEELREGAEVSAERMRMQLLAPANGNAVISIGMADQTAYNYNYDPDGSWKATNYEAVNNVWSTPATATPLTDIANAKAALAAKGYAARYILMNSVTMKQMFASDEVKNAFIVASGMNVGYISDARLREVVEANTGLTILVYDKQFIDYDGTTKKFYPDGYATVIAGEALGNTWYGTTPEEATLMTSDEADVALYDDRIAVAQKVEYGPPVRRDTTVAQICLPSFEGMDGVYVLKVN